jgi:hypothetical protein
MRNPTCECLLGKFSKFDFFPIFCPIEWLTRWKYQPFDSRHQTLVLTSATLQFNAINRVWNNDTKEWILSTGIMQLLTRVLFTLIVLQSSTKTPLFHDDAQFLCHSLFYSKHIFVLRFTIYTHTDTHARFVFSSNLAGIKT